MGSRFGTNQNGIDPNQNAAYLRTNYLWENMSRMKTYDMIWPKPRSRMHLQLSTVNCTVHQHSCWIFRRLKKCQRKAWCQHKAWSIHKRFISGDSWKILVFYWKSIVFLKIFVLKSILLLHWKILYDWKTFVFLP